MTTETLLCSVQSEFDAIARAAERLIEMAVAAGFREIPLIDARHIASLIAASSTLAEAAIKS